MRTSINTRRVLFVDDDAALGKMFADFLSASGYHVRTTVTGAEALQQLGEFQPHLVVLDIGWGSGCNLSRRQARYWNSRSLLNYRYGPFLPQLL